MSLQRNWFCSSKNIISRLRKAAVMAAFFIPVQQLA
jgi:hypothetical protein